MPWQIIALILLAIVLYLLVAPASGFVQRIRGAAGALPSLAGLGAKLASFAGKGWVKLAAIPLVIALVWGGIAFIKHQGVLEERVREEQANTEIAEHETHVANRGAELAEHTHRDAARAATIVAEAKQEITDAVSQADFDRVYASYQCGYLGVFASGPCARQPDPAPAGPGPMRGAAPSPV